MFIPKVSTPLSLTALLVGAAVLCPMAVAFESDDSSQAGEKRVVISSVLPARKGRGALIQWVVDHRTQVNKGDILIRFESQEFEEALAKSQAQILLGEADLIKAKAQVDLAQIALQAFVEGEFALELEQLELEVYEAERRLKLAESTGGPVDLERKRLSVAKMRLKVHVEFTKAKRVAMLEAEIAVAKAGLEAQMELASRRRASRDQLTRELKSCEIRSPVNGRISHSTSKIVKPGESAWKGQPLLYITQD